MNKELTAVDGKLILFGATFACSKCHQSGRHVVVQSRRNGFVTQNCEYCGHPEPLKQGEIPALLCRQCGSALEPCWDWGNYAYRCGACRTKRFLLHTVVPHWSDLFDYDGFALESDLARPQNMLTAEQLRAFLASVRSNRQ